MRALTLRQRIAAVTLLIVGFAFVTLDLTGGKLAGAHGGARGALGSLYRGTDSMVGPVRRFLEGVPHVASNRSEIARLTGENARLREQLATSQADSADAARLSALAAEAHALAVRSIAARVVGYGPGEQFDWTATIDAGTSSGVRVGQTVTDGDGLVGRVLHTNGSTSLVLLAADPGSGVGVRDARNGQLGVVTGTGGGGFTLSPLDPAADIRVGDQLITGPAGETTFVAGVPVGTVTAVRRAGDGTTTVTVRPATSPTSINVVGVLVPIAATGIAPSGQAAK